MKGFLFSISLLLGILGFTQTEEKPMYYVDVNGDYITKELFEEKRKYQKGKPGYLKLYFESDSSFITMLHSRKKYGKLKSEEHEILRNYLDSLNNEPISINKFIVIQWYPGKDPCNSPTVGNSGWNRYQNSYHRKLKKIFNHKLLWIYKNDENLEKHRKKKLSWLYDKNRIVELMLFPYHFPCGSFAIISPSGNYIGLYGEYGYREIIEISEEMKKSNPQ